MSAAVPGFELGRGVGRTIRAQLFIMRLSLKTNVYLTWIKGRGSVPKKSLLSKINCCLKWCISASFNYFFHRH